MPGEDEEQHEALLKENESAQRLLKLAQDSNGEKRNEIMKQGQVFISKGAISKTSPKESAAIQQLFDLQQESDEEQVQSECSKKSLIETEINVDKSLEEKSSVSVDKLEDDKEIQQEPTSQINMGEEKVMTETSLKQSGAIQQLLLSQQESDEEEEVEQEILYVSVQKHEGQNLSEKKDNSTAKEITSEQQAAVHKLFMSQQESEEEVIEDNLPPSRLHELQNEEKTVQEEMVLVKNAQEQNAAILQLFKSNEEEEAEQEILSVSVQKVEGQNLSGQMDISTANKDPLEEQAAIHKLLMSQQESEEKVIQDNLPSTSLQEKDIRVEKVSVKNAEEQSAAILQLFQSQQESEDESEDNQLFTLKPESKQEQNHEEQICSNDLQKQKNIVLEKVTATETSVQNAAIQQMFKFEESDDEKNDIQPTSLEDFAEENTTEPAIVEKNALEQSAVILQLFESQQQIDDEGVEGNGTSLTGLEQLHAAETNMKGVNVHEITI